MTDEEITRQGAAGVAASTWGKRRKLALETGLCMGVPGKTCGNKVVPGKAHCEECMKVERERWRLARRKRRARYLEQGCCVDCGKKSFLSRCLECHRRNRPRRTA